LFGIPYQYTLSQVLKARLTFMRDCYQIRDDDFLTFDALRQSAQCIGRVIRSKTDYGIVILADSRFNRLTTRQRFPNWIKQFVRETALNLTTDVAIDQMKTFLRVMGQPIDQTALRQILYNEKELEKFVNRYRLGLVGEGEQQHLMSRAHIQPAVAGVNPVIQEFQAVPVPPDPLEQITNHGEAMNGVDMDEGYYDEMEMYLEEAQNETKQSSAESESKLSEEQVMEKSKQLRTSLFLFEDILD
jgi:hypothetical protein